MLTGAGFLIHNASGLCLAANVQAIGAPLGTFKCSPLLPKWAFSPNGGSGALVYGTESGLCLDARTTKACTDADLSSLPFCNPSLATVDRVNDLVSRLGPADYALLLSTDGVGVPRLGVPMAASAFGESLHGVWSGGGAPYTNASTGFTSSGNPTSFPPLLVLSQTFNRSLWAAVAATVGDEAVGLRNQLNEEVTHAFMFFSPDVNLFRNPLFGRGQEVPGEDPTLTSEFVAVYVNALQYGPVSQYKKVVATCKHVSVYDSEDLRPQGIPITRFNFDANVSLGDLVQYYWPPFQSCVARARSGGLMCSYPSLNGVPSCANDFVNNVVVRGEWGFEGFIISDCGAFSLLCSPNCYTYNLGHNYTSTYNATVGVAMRGGMDAACDPFFQPSVVPSFESGNVSLGTLATAGARFLTQVFDVGLMDPPGNNPYWQYGKERVDTAGARALAFEAAVQGSVLLKNANSTLPLRVGGGPGSLKRMAVIGPNANSTRTLLSNYHGETPVVNDQSVLQALQRAGLSRGFAVEFAPGCPSLLCPNASGFPAATAAASRADVAIVVLGLCPQDCPTPEDAAVREEEMHDRTVLTLPGQQEALLQAVVATGTPTVLVLVHGGALAIEWAAANVPAILDLHYPGEMGGDAAVALLLGDASPSGRLTTTVYKADFVHQRNATDMSLGPHDGVPGITYLYVSEDLVLYPFGWGMSYTSFRFDWFNADSGLVSVNASEWLASTAPPSYAVNVTNTGGVTSDVVALAFLSSGVPGDPIEQLFDFQRAAAVAPGATVTLYFATPRSVAARMSQDGVQALVPGRLQVRIGDVHSTGNFVSGALDVTGTQQVVLFDGPALLKSSL